VVIGSKQVFKSLVLPYGYR